MVRKKDYGFCIKEFTNRLQEHCLQYALEKAMDCKNLDEFKTVLKKEISNLHKRNMELMDCKINGT